jgi:sensor histidine kinase regulating citrate/malate metabolism
VKLVRQAIKEQKAVTTIASFQNRELLKMYLPVKIKPSADITDKNGTLLTEYVLTLTADYRVIRETLHRQFTSLITDIVVVTVVTLCLIAVIYRLVGRTRDKYVKTAQETYIDEVNQMFTAIRGQRHDLLNHMHTVHALVKLKKYGELEAYTGELIEDTVMTTDLITIGQPAIAALVQSKLTTAVQRKIGFTYDFENLTNFPLGVRAVDIVKIVGNLIDNAFDAVDQLSAENRRVHLKGAVENNILQIMISNPGQIPEDKIEAIFEAGYSTKNGKHSGLGLAIAKQLVKKYNGDIMLKHQEPGTVVFTVSIELP